MKTVITSAITNICFVMVFVLTSITASSQCTVLTPGVVAGPANVCAAISSGDQVTYSIEAIPFASAYEWVIPPTNITLISGQGTTSITVTFQNGFQLQANRQLRVRAIYPCGISGYRVFYIQVQSPNTPRPIVPGVQDICAFIGTGNAVAYTIPTAAGASSYVWTSPAGTTVLHPNGEGANDTSVLVTFANGFVSGDICVQSVNNCGVSGIRCFTIRTSTPIKPSLISGTTNVCGSLGESGTPITYAVAPIPGAVSYTWTTPANTTVTHPNGTGSSDFSITVAYPAGFTTGTISVSVTTACGTSGVRELNVNRLLPSAPGAITGTEVSSCPDRIYQYSIVSLPLNSTSVQWEVPANATIISGQGTTAILVYYLPVAINGRVSATGESNCGSSQTRTLAVNLTACDGPPPPPPPPFSRGFINPVLEGSAMLSVQVSPNPSAGDFKVKVLTAANERMYVRLLDISGRTVRTMNMMPTEVIQFGNDLKAGIYFIEVTQGKIKKTEKLVRY